LVFERPTSDDSIGWGGPVSERLDQRRDVFLADGVLAEGWIVEESEVETLEEKSCHASGSEGST
jgi:hypothetical protein